MSQVTPLPISPPPGIVVTESSREAAGRWVAPYDKLRFVKGRPQKIGGNIRVTATPMLGSPRALIAWRDFLQNQYMAAGTYAKLYAFDSSFVTNDITPYSSTGTLGNNPFTTANSSTIVTVAHTAHARSAGDYVIFSGATAINSVTMTGTFIVQTIIGPNSYTLIGPNTASGSGAGGGNAVAFSYEIPIGTELGAYGQGWGVGKWGLDTWGTPRGSSTIFYEPRIWSLDHFGVVMLATYNGGSLWAFDPTHSQPWPRAVSTFGGTAMNAPADFRAMFVTPERYVFGLCNSMVVKVCSQNDPTIWTPATSNTAFQRTLQEGTKLVGGRVLAPFLSLVWTDSALNLFQWTGDTFVYRSSLAGKDCGLISPGAAATVDGAAYWMGPDNFYGYNGAAVAPLPNVEDIRKYVFDAIPVSLAYQCTAVYVPKYHEIWFFYPTIGASNPTNYVIYHITDQCWSIGAANFYSSLGVTAGRVSGTHFTQGDTSPFMGGADGYIYNHDPIGDTFNDNGNPLTWTLTLSPYAMNSGLQNMDLLAINFDFKDQIGNISAAVLAYNYLTDSTPMDSDTETVPDIDAGLSDFRVSGRYLGLTLSSSDLNNYMRFGVPVAQVQPTGNRS